MEGQLQSDTETAPKFDGDGSDVWPFGRGDMEHPILGEVAGGFEEVSASAVARVAFRTLDGVDLVVAFATLFLFAVGSRGS